MIALFKKYISILISFVFLTSMLTVSVCAANVFDDVTSNQYSWAKDQIEEMAELGIIKGYNNKIFAPEDSVTKIQALLLCSRILGFIDDDAEDLIDDAYKLYGDIVIEYNEEYVSEICYLIYKGVLSTDELSLYISEDNAAVALKRYEVATIMTKAMNAVSEAEKLTSPTVFKDSADIPAASKPYVNYVYSKGLMQGMTPTEFVPLYKVTRAQMAVMLYRMREALDETRIYAVVDKINSGTIMYTDYDGNAEGLSILSKADTKVYIDGYLSSLNNIAPKSIICITKRGTDIYRIDAITVKGDEIILGSVTSVTTSSKGSKIKVQEISSSAVLEFPVSENVSVTYSKAASSLSNIKAGTYVELHLKDGEVMVINAAPRQTTVVGTVTDIILSPEVLLYVKLSSGEIEKYMFSDEVTVERNGKTVNSSDVLVGDKVNMTLTYNQISTIKATSSSFKDTGTIEEIKIAVQPSITIKSDGKSTTYSLSRDAAYEIDGADATIYDLRLNGTVTVTIEGETVTKVTSSSPTVASALTGKISVLNSAYGFFILDSTESSGKLVSTQVFFKGNFIKIYDSVARKEVSATALKQNMNVTVTGYMDTGAFVASAIVILP